jgi:predicted NAD-dependent protein-ADP-ribosyltransferase YbiA (DUF1768 family)
MMIHKSGDRLLLVSPYPYDERLYGAVFLMFILYKLFMVVRFFVSLWRVFFAFRTNFVVGALMSMMKTLTFLRQKTGDSKPIKINKKMQKILPKKNAKPAENNKNNKKEKYDTSKLTQDALQRQKDSKSTLINLYWDKIYFNNEIKETSWLSNECLDYPFEENGIEYKSRLHYFYSAAVLQKKHKDMIRGIRDLDTLESLYKKVDKNPKWESLNYRKKVMRAACETQIAQNLILMRRIKKTGDYTDFVYLNPNDGFFGTGQSGRGFNHLGKILQDCRTLLTDKENNGFVMLFTEHEWVHPDTEFSGMLESAKKYIANQFQFVEKDLPDPYLNPMYDHKKNSEALELLSAIKNINSHLNLSHSDRASEFETSMKRKSRKISINLRPLVEKYMENERQKQR